jgi:hypothetical protein
MVKPRERAGAYVDYLLLRPDEERALMIDVTRFFDMTAEGRYRISVRCHWRGQTWGSREHLVSVVSGIEVASITRSVSGYEDQPRTYSLRYWRRKGMEYLFLSIDDKSTARNLGVFSLGAVIRVFRPVLRVDRFGNIIVVHQSGRIRYTRSVFRIEQDVVSFIDQSYHLEDGSPYPDDASGVTIRHRGDDQEPGIEED